MANRHIIKRDMIGMKYAPCNTKKCVNYYNTQYINATGYCKPCEDKRRKNDNNKMP